MKVLVVHSGGLDSTVVLAMALKDGDNEVETVSFSYGSKHERMELGAALRIVEFYEIQDNVIVVPQIFGEQSALLFDGKIKMPHMTYREIREAEGPSQTVVPFRNGVFLAMAVALAAGKGFDEVHVGMHAEDAHNSAYPDCRFDFVGAFAAAAYIGTYHQIKVVAPLINMQKADVVWCGNKLNVPFHLTWSCYDPVSAVNSGAVYVYACGLCPTCSERIHAFKVCGFADPIPYAIPVEW